MNLSIIYRQFGEIYRFTESPRGTTTRTGAEAPGAAFSDRRPIWDAKAASWLSIDNLLPFRRNLSIRVPCEPFRESTDNQPTFAINRPMGRKRPANGGIKKMAELSATLYEQFAEADRLEATIKRNLEVLGYGE